MPIRIYRYWSFNVCTSIIYLFEEWRGTRDNYIYLDVLFLKDWLVRNFILFIILLFEIESQILVAHGYVHTAQWLFGMVYPSLGLFSKVASYADRTEIQFKPLRRFA